MASLRRALVTAVLLVPLGIPASGAEECGAPRPDGWAVAEPAPFAAGGPLLTGFAMLPRHPDVLLVTNGTALQVSRDAGCTWTAAALPADPLPAPLSGGREILDIEPAPLREGNEAIWVLAQEGGVLGHPVVFRSEDLGGSFAGVSDGLPPAGTATALTAGSDGSTAYAVVDVPALGRRLYRVTDGRTWEPAAPASTGEFGYDDVAVDTLDSGQVFAWNTATIAVSYDGGAVFRTLELPGEGAIRDVALGQAPRGSRLAVLREDGHLYRSDDGGKSWTPRRVDPRATQAAAAPEVDVAAVAGEGVVTLLPAVFAPIDVSPSGVEPLDLALGLLPGGDVRVAGRSDVAVLGYAGRALPAGESGRAVVDLRAARLTVPVDPAILPARREVTLAPGETRVVDYEFDVPASPTPIEVFFLVDTTASMGPVIDGIREGLVRIVNDLAGAGISGQFGVAEVRDYPVQPYGEPGDLPYHLLRKVGPVDEELEEALAALVARGGGDGPESMTTGYHQLATGEGEVFDGALLVPPGDDAGFSDGVLRIVLATTDVPYHNEEDYPGPLLHDAHDTLVAHRINVVGLAANGGGHEHLRLTAAATGTRAPAPGIDCDLDGIIDLPTGAPLVCAVRGGLGLNIGSTRPGELVDTRGAAGIARAIVTLLRGIRDPALLTLSSAAPDVAKVVGSPAVGVDLKVPHAVPYRVRLSCPARRYGSRVDASLTGLARGVPLATSGLHVRCLPPEPLEELYLGDLPRPLAAAAAAPPPPPQLQPVHNVNPQGNPQGNPDANFQLQAGAAHQRQEQLQLALAHDGAVDLGRDQELAMVRRDPPAVLVPAAAALMATVAAAAAARTRSRVRPAYATGRRRRTV
jgi:hypothetical protein